MTFHHTKTKLFSLICILFFMVSTISAQTYYQRGYRSVTFNDPSRSGRAISTDLYYPASTAGTNVPVATGTVRFPVVVFGHGFTLPASAYARLADTLTRYGYIAAFPNTETGLAPSHDNFGKDLSFLCTAILQLDIDASSFLYRRVTSKAAVGGHSMGGGCSMLAAGSGNSNIFSVFNFAAAETNPSATTAAASINFPSLLFSGSNDCIVPPATQQSMYNNIPNSCKTRVNITGATHCQVADNAFNCVFGQISSGCNSSPINVNTYYNKATEVLIPFLDYTLNGVCQRGIDYVNKLNTLTGAIVTSNCPLPNCSILPVQIKKFSGSFNQYVTLRIDAAYDGMGDENLIIEKSKDGEHFNTWKTIQPQSYSEQIQLEIKDIDFNTPVSYYRLLLNKQTTPTYTDILAIRTAPGFQAVAIAENPTNRTFRIQLISAVKETLQFRIISTDGKIWQQFSQSVNSGVQLLEIPVHLLGAGIYILEIQAARGSQSTHLRYIKTH
jgi:pimeloyl-ACP methyl ester carboxylesterase